MIYKNSQNNDDSDDNSNNNNDSNSDGDNNSENGGDSNSENKGDNTEKIYIQDKPSMLVNSNYVMALDFSVNRYVEHITVSKLRPKVIFFTWK